jgi:hypothetical protein
MHGFVHSARTSYWQYATALVSSKRLPAISRTPHTLFMTKPHPVTSSRPIRIPALDNICHNWHLSSATRCLNGVIKPDGPAKDWPAGLVRSLSELSNITRGDHAAVERELRQACQVRVRVAINTDRNLLVQDLTTVHKRRHGASQGQQPKPTGTGIGPSRQPFQTY